MSDPIILGGLYAGGRARRLGGVDKSTLKLGGRFLHEIAITNLQSVCDDIVVLAPAPPNWLGEYANLRHLKDELRDETSVGPIGGLASVLSSALSQYGTTAIVLTMPIDTPLIPRSELKKLIEVARDTNLPAILFGQERAHPTLAAWPSGIADEIHHAIREGDYALHKAAERLGASFVQVSGNQDLLLNINRPEDLDRAKEISEKF